MAITVEEIKARLPHAEVYTLDPDAKHLILIKRDTPMATIDAMAKALQRLKLTFIMLIVHDPSDSVKLLEIKDGQ